LKFGLSKKNNSVGLALGGGGVRGLAAVPILKTLDDLGVSVSFIAGTSMGAILGCLYALGLSGNDIESRVRDHIVSRNDNFRAIYRKRKNLLRWLRLFGIATEKGGILSADGAFKYLFKEISEHEFQDVKIDFCSIATDYWSGEEIVLDSGPLLPAIKASMAVPGIFHPVKSENRLLFDGGLVNNLPYDWVQDKTDFCIAVDVSNLPTDEDKETPSSYEAMIGAVDIMQVEMLRRKMNLRQPDILIQPKIADVKILDFHEIEYVLECGEKAATELRTKIENNYPWLIKND
jgi:NTE family protein